MKYFRYLNNVITLFLLKIKHAYQGRLIQNIGSGSGILVHNGKLSIEGKLNTRSNVYLSSEGGILQVGKDCFLNQNVYIVSMQSIIIGDGTIIGPNVVIVDHDHNYKVSNRQHDFITSPIVIGKNVWIGANVIVLKGSIIGDNSVIAAGSVVRGCYPPNSLVYEKRTLVEKEF